MSAESNQPAKPDRIRVESRVAEVVVAEDRARVVRRCSVELQAGSVRVELAGCSPLIQDKTLSGALVGAPPGAKVLDLRVRRFLRARLESKPAELAEARRRLEDAQGKCSKMEAARDALEAQIEGLSAAFGLTAEEIAQDAAFGRSDPQRWAALLESLSARESEARAARCKVEAGLAKLEKTRSDLLGMVALMEDPGSVMGAALEVDVECAQHGACELEVSYMVPCACWRPAHTVAVLDGKARCRVSSEACLWQSTGEDWTDAQISFSTQRPSLGTKPPVLTEDVLVAQDRRDKVEVEARDQEVQTLAPGGKEGGRKSRDMPGIDDGGTALSIRAQGRTSVKSDGSPHRIPVGSFESAADKALVCMPEVSAAVVTRLDSSNSSQGPMLAGPVDLIGESGFVGRTSTLFVAPGERFELGLGPDPDLRVFRKTDRVDKDKSMLSKWIRTVHTVTVNLSNIGPAAKKLRLTERIPVSEIEQVRVDFDSRECSPKAEPDENGFLHWDLSIPGFGKSTVRFSYAVDRTADVTGL